jgi:hypothetical protein
MSWRDGCAPRPPVHAHAEPVTFDFAGADALGQRLDVLRTTITANLDARAAGQARLVDWAGGHRQQYDEHRATQEAVLTGADVAAQIARLRGAWDEAAAAQVRANTRAADIVADGGQVPR